MIDAGYVGSGPIVLLLELFLQIGPQPSSGQIVVLFELVAAFTIAGEPPPPPPLPPLSLSFPPFPLP